MRHGIGDQTLSGNLRYQRQPQYFCPTRCGADYYEFTDAQFTDWKREKFRAFAIAKSYDRTLFVDSDCLIRNTCPDLFELVPSSHVGLHDDWSHLLHRDWVYPTRKQVFDSQGIVDRVDSQSVYNSGVVICSRATASVWTPPLKPLPRHHVAEQFLVERQAMEHPLYTLPSQLNCQWWFRDFAERRKSGRRSLRGPSTRLAALPYVCRHDLDYLRSGSQSSNRFLKTNR